MLDKQRMLALPFRVPKSTVWVSWKTWASKPSLQRTFLALLLFTPDLSRIQFTARFELTAREHLWHSWLSAGSFGSKPVQAITKESMCNYPQLLHHTREADLVAWASDSCCRCLTCNAHKTCSTSAAAVRRLWPGPERYVIVYLLRNVYCLMLKSVWLHPGLALTQCGHKHGAQQ